MMKQRDAALGSAANKVDAHLSLVALRLVRSIFALAATGLGIWQLSLVPGLVPNAPAGYPLLGRGRIQDEGYRLRISDDRKDADELNSWSLPHA